MSRRANAAAAALVVGLLSGATGCSSPRPASDTLPSTSASAPTTSADALPALGPADFPVPDEARQQTAEGAAAFIAYYIGLINRSNGDLDTRYLERFSSSCETCDQIIRDTDQDRQAGYEYLGGELTITSSGPASLLEDRAEQAFRVDQAAVSVIDTSGAPVAERQLPAFSSLSSGATVRWGADRSTWSMVGLTFG